MFLAPCGFYDRNKVYSWGLSYYICSFHFWPCTSRSTKDRVVSFCYSWSFQISSFMLCLSTVVKFLFLDFMQIGSGLYFSWSLLRHVKPVIFSRILNQQGQIGLPTAVVVVPWVSCQIGIWTSTRVFVSNDLPQQGDAQKICRSGHRLCLRISVQRKWMCKTSF